MGLFQRQMIKLSMKGLKLHVAAYPEKRKIIFENIFNNIDTFGGKFDPMFSINKDRDLAKSLLHLSAKLPRNEAIDIAHMLTHRADKFKASDRSLYFAMNGAGAFFLASSEAKLEFPLSMKAVGSKKASALNQVIDTFQDLCHDH